MTKYQVTYNVDYPNRPLDRGTTLVRAFFVIPALVVLGALSTPVSHQNHGPEAFLGVLFFAPLLMILFRQKYPRWWFDWNLQILRFSSRVAVYLALMDDRYPSTDEEQSVHLDIQYPNASKDLNRWLPLVKWFLAIPHYVVLLFLNLVAFVVTIMAWFTILFTGRFPRSLFDFVEGVMRWNLRVVGYAFILVTDDYPPFRLAE